jgi:hypothetical protein
MQDSLYSNPRPQNKQTNKQKSPAATQLHEPCPPTLFALVILEIGPHFLHRPAWTAILRFYTSHCSWFGRHTSQCLTFFPVEMGALKLFRLGWTGILLFPILAFHVARITGVSHQSPAYLLFLGNVIGNYKL